MRTTIFVAALTLVAAGCGARPIAIKHEEAGSARLFVGAQSQRALQYLVSDIKAVKVTVKDAADNTLVRQDLFTGAALAAKLPVNSHAFSFAVDNLKVSDASHPMGYSYKATVEAFRETAATTSMGISTSNPFAVQNNQATTVAMPNLTLAPTATGSWRITVTVPQANKRMVDSYFMSLEQINHQVATASFNSGVSIDSSATSITKTVGNVLAFPTGASTLSITVNGHQTNGQQSKVSNSGIATASIQPGVLSISAISINLP